MAPRGRTAVSAATTSAWRSSREASVGAPAPGAAPSEVFIPVLCITPFTQRPRNERYRRGSPSRAASPRHPDRIGGTRVGFAKSKTAAQVRKHGVSMFHQLLTPVGGSLSLSFLV